MDTTPTKDAGDSPSGPPSGATTPKVGNKLDSLSREDLIKFVKRQMLNVQKVRAQNQELEAHNSAFKKAVETMETESSQQLEEEKSRAQKELKKLQEQIDCLGMKDETLSAAFAAMQEELKKSQDDYKVVQQECHKLVTERNDAMEALNKANEKVKEADLRLEEQNSVNNNLEREMKEKEEKEHFDMKSFQDVKDRLAATEEVIGPLKEQNVALLDEIDKLQKQLKEKGDVIQQERDSRHSDMEQEIKQLKNQLEGFEDQQKQLAEWEGMMTLLKQDRDSFEQQVADCESKEQTMAKDLEELNAALQEALAERDSLRSEAVETGDLRLKVTALSQENEVIRTNLAELRDQFDDATRLSTAQGLELERRNAEMEDIRMNSAQREDEMRTLKNLLRDTQKADIPNGVSDAPGADDKDTTSQNSDNALEIGELRNEIQRLQKVNSDLESRLNGATNEDVVSHDDCVQDESVDVKETTVYESCVESAASKDSILEENRKLLKQVEELQQHASDIAEVKKQLKEKDDKLEKMKVVALRAKKELSDNKAQKRSEVCDAESVGVHAQKTAELNEELRRLTQENIGVKLQLEQLRDQHDENVETVEELQKELDKKQELVNELDELKREKTAESIIAKELKDKVASLEKELATSHDSLRQQKEEHKVALEGADDLKVKAEEALQKTISGLKEELVAAEKGVHQSSMMDLEIADYERTVQCLNEQLKEKDTVVEEVKSEVKRQEDKVTSLTKQLDAAESQCNQAEERGNKLKQLLVQSKKDLTKAKTEEAEQLAQSAQLQGETEKLTGQNEELKLQVADMAAENRKLKERMRNSEEHHSRKTKSMETTIQSLQQDLELSRSDVSAVTAEYDGYKVRVHNVLKSQKSRGQTEATLEAERQEKAQLSQALTAQESRASELLDQLQTVRAELQVVQDEVDRLQLREQRLAAELVEQDKRHKDRMERIQRETMTTNHEQMETIRSLTQQNDDVNKTFKMQLTAMQDEHRRSSDILQKQLDGAEKERELAHVTAPVTSTTHQRQPSSDVEEIIRDPRQTERPVLEGMEKPEETAFSFNSVTSQGSTLQSPTSSTVPLDALINRSSVDLAESYVKAPEDPEELKLMLVTAEKKAEHVTELLHESEAAVLLLTEQAKVLKEEIRRQFLSLETLEERNQLLPVLTTMLKLSPEEQTRLEALTGKTTPKTDSSAWSAYLHKWTGPS